MPKTTGRGLFYLILVVTAILTAPQIGLACDAFCPFGSCNGSYCCCTSFGQPSCSDFPPINGGCGGIIENFNSTPENLAAFKARIDKWSANSDLAPMVEASTSIYEAMLFHDREGLVKANEEFQKAIGSLSEKGRKALIQSERGQPDNNN